MRVWDHCTSVLNHLGGERHSYTGGLGWGAVLEPRRHVAGVEGIACRCGIDDIAYRRHVDELIRPVGVKKYRLRSPFYNDFSNSMPLKAVQAGLRRCVAEHSSLVFETREC